MQATLPERMLAFWRRRRPVALARGLQELTRALDEAPAPVCFWWRDDDAGPASPRLDRLLAIADDLRVPVSLGVVPAWLEPATIEHVRACEQATVLQHGFDHVSHARPGAEPIELGGDLTPTSAREQLVLGRAKLERAFGHKLLPILVPPWNRIDPAVVPVVDALGYLAVSAAPHINIPGLRAPRLDAQVDLIDWHAYLRHLPMLLPLAARLHRCRSPGSIAAEIAARIDADPTTLIGLLTHHQLMAEPDMAALEQLLRLLRGHPRVRWLTPGQIVMPERRRAKPARREAVPA